MTNAELRRIQGYLDNFDFESLFIEELGWDVVSKVSLPIVVKDDSFELTTVVQKRGVLVWQCVTPVIPPRATLLKIEREISVASKLVVFCDEIQSQQTWVWSQRYPGKRRCLDTRSYTLGKDILPSFKETIEGLIMPYEEEDRLTIVDVVIRANKAFSPLS